MDINPILLASAIMVASTPILLAAIGELVVERAGVLNLGVEGMMITGAVIGFIATHETESTTLGFMGAAVGGAVVSMIFGVLTQYLLTNQVATGLALTLFGVGLSALVGQGYQATNQVPVTKMPIPMLSDIPVLGPILFRHDGVVYLSLIAVVAVFWFLSRSRAGMILRAVGENHDAAHALGYNVRHVRLMAIAFGGACAGLGGAYISLARVPQWVDNITAGTGWIALAIVVFASWKPWRLLIGAYLFGGVTALQINIQAMGLDIPVEYLSMSPYIATILVLVFMSGGRAPGSLGRIFSASS
ncbi:ABC transporter permease [Rhodobacteraceae bacterium]|nr:ABC transporter permease [Paracoccaceae bacterium]